MRCARRGPKLRTAAVPALKAFDASCGVNQFLLAGEERMAIVADFQTRIRRCCVGLEGIATRAGYGHQVQLGMDIFLHGYDPRLFRLEWPASTPSTAVRRLKFRNRGGYRRSTGTATPWR